MDETTYLSGITRFDEERSNLKRSGGVIGAREQGCEGKHTRKERGINK